MIFPKNNTHVDEYPILPENECLAKTENGKKGCDVYTHLAVTCRILRVLRELAAGTPRAELIDAAAEILCAYHDIGKMTPGFQQKIYHSLGLKPDLGPTIPQANHAEYSGWILRRQFGERFGTLAQAHHGIESELGNDFLYNDDTACCGGLRWVAQRKHLRERLQRDLQLPECDLHSLSVPRDSLTLGATILADWLSSGMNIPFGIMPDDNAIRHAVLSAGFTPFQIKSGLDFEDIFGFVPNQLQMVCRETPKPGGIYVVESEMGSGKTEAALYLAYQLLEKKQVNGIYFALPTQLTSEKIHERLNFFLEKILQDPEAHTSLLIHGDAWLEWALHTASDEDMETTYQPDQWFQSKKRALLAPFGAGTIDQALLSVIHVKHRALRAFALSGKAVIIDEVHSYDDYTGTLLKRLIEYLREWGCTVILLSATLTHKARNSFALLPADANPGQMMQLPYPLVTEVLPDGKITSRPVKSERRKTVAVEFQEEIDALRLAVQKAKAGEQVLWIENTVAQAQKVFKDLASNPDQKFDIGLIHSRFPRCVRAKNEEKWVSLLGKNGGAQRQEKGRILIGTQILEQSIDIDADLLISRLAPLDLLFQRMGRLWRHLKLDCIRPSGATCRAVLIGDPVLDNPDRLWDNQKAFLPYEILTLFCTREILRDRKSIFFPDEIRPLLEKVYAERTGPESILSLQHVLECKKLELERYANISASAVARDTMNEDVAQTRLNDEPSVQLLLLCKGCAPERDHEIRTPFSDRPIPLPGQESSTMQRTEASVQLMQCLITMRESLAPRYEDFDTSFLSPLIWTGNTDFHPVRAAYVDECGNILDHACISLNACYDKERGYTVCKGEK